MSLLPLLLTPAPAQPNVVVILAGDTGVSDAGSDGGEIWTPNIDDAWASIA